MIIGILYKNAYYLYKQSKHFNMSKPGKTEELEDEVSTEDSTAFELGVLTGAILDYYETTGAEGFDEGEAWKKGTEHDNRKAVVEIPEDLNAEVKKAFMTQIKKFQ